MLRVWLAAACFATIVGCGGTPSSPTEIPTSQLLSAPTRIFTDGKTLTLATFLWRDFMPPAPADGRPLQGVLRIVTHDGSAVGTAVAMDTSWVIYNAEVGAAAVEPRPRAETASHLEVVVRNGPKWGPDVTVDVVVRLRDSAGSMFLLRAANQTIGATW